MDPVAAHDDLVAVLEGAPFDPVPVDEDAVEAAVVEHPDAVRLAHDQGVAARDGRVVEADVGGEAAADPRPLAGERDDGERLPVLVGEVLAGLGELRLGVSEPALALLLGLVLGLAGEVGGEQRGAGEHRAAAAGAVRQRVMRVQGDHVSAVGALERAGTGQGPGGQGLHGHAPSHDAPLPLQGGQSQRAPCADNNQAVNMALDECTSFPQEKLAPSGSFSGGAGGAFFAALPPSGDGGRWPGSLLFLGSAQREPDMGEVRRVRPLLGGVPPWPGGVRGPVPELRW
jgi:hypothetical protein